MVDDPFIAQAQLLNAALGRITDIALFFGAVLANHIGLTGFAHGSERIGIAECPDHVVVRDRNGQRQRIEDTFVPVGLAFEF